MIPKIASSPNVLWGLILTGDKVEIVHRLPRSRSPAHTKLLIPQLIPNLSLNCPCPQKASSSTSECVVNIGSQSFLVSGQHCSAPRRGPTNLVCLCRASARLEDAEIMLQPPRGPAAGLAASGLCGSEWLVPGEQPVSGPHHGK